MIAIFYHRYWGITVLRALLLKETDPKKFNLIKRMTDHNEEHIKDQDNWNMYKTNVVDFLRRDCGLANRYRMNRMNFAEPRCTFAVLPNVYALNGQRQTFNIRNGYAKVSSVLD